MKKVISKILIILLICFSLFSLLSTKTYAKSISDIFTKADGFIKKGQSSSSGTAISEDTIKDMSEMIYNILLVIGVVIAVILGMIIGIKFMTGSVEEKAKLKETLVAYIAGCVVVFGAFSIWRIVVIVLQSAPSA